MKTKQQLLGDVAAALPAPSLREQVEALPVISVRLTRYVALDDVLALLPDAAPAFAHSATEEPLTGSEGNG